MRNEPPSRSPEQPQPEEPFADPTVEEIREIRRRQWERAGRNVREYIRQAQETVERIGPSAGGASVDRRSGQNAL